MPPAAHPVAAVLFDLDGTLVSTKELYLEAYRRALVPVFGRRVSDAEIFAHGAVGERRFLEATAADRLDECLQCFYQEYRALHSQLFGGVYAGIPELLAELRGRGLKLGVVTGKSRDAWLITSELTELGHFHTVVVDDDVEVAKPDPAGLRLALEALGVAPEAAMYVGDSPVDLGAATNAGARPAAAMWSRDGERRTRFLTEARRFRAAILEHPAQLLDLL